MSTALNLASLAAQGELKIPIARGVVSEGGSGTDYTGWSGVSSVFVEAKVEVREQSRGFATLTLTVEGSSNGTDWSTLQTFTFGHGGTQTATVSSPDDHLRVSWDVGGGSEWQIIEVTAAPSIIDTGGGGSATVLVLQEGSVGGTRTPGGSYAAPVSAWTVIRDDAGALQDDEQSVILPSGLWLCGGMFDTANSWAGSSGYIGVSVVGGAGSLNSDVPWQAYISAAAVALSGAALHATPVMVKSPGDSGPTSIALRLQNDSDITVEFSGMVLWAQKVADLP